ncbi:hypothetical protein HDU86_007914 [Geranomyces michiganensis]|nr:hypothetical protein HDU86_007914 [Geranomyces michiganensis]
MLPDASSFSLPPPTYASSISTAASSNNLPPAEDPFDPSTFTLLPLVVNALEALHRAVAAAGALNNNNNQTAVSSSTATRSDSAMDEADSLIRTVDARIRDAHDLVRSLPGIEVSQAAQVAALKDAERQLAVRREQLLRAIKQRPEDDSRGDTDDRMDVG